jgi:hypothetical protein
MSVAKLVDDYVLEFGNTRFLEGWYGAKEHVINVIETEHKYHYGDVYGSANCNCGTIIMLIKDM